MSKGKLFIISAPSGAGKGTVISRLREMHRELIISVSATTRAPRRGEREGISYYFVSRDRFLDMINTGQLMEYAEYVGEYYGTPKKPIEDSIKKGKSVLLEIEVQGAKQIISQKPEAVSIFIVPPDMKELERRLRTRGTDSEEKLAERLRTAVTELAEKEKYNYVVINDDATRAAGEILEIINRNSC